MAHATSIHNPGWTWGIPAASVAILLLSLLAPGLPGLVLLLCIGLLGGVVCAVHHAEVIALKVGEPFGTLVLALSVTTIEVALIVSMMFSGDPADAMGLPRDTIFAAVMIILNAIIGLSLIVGGRRHRIQQFNVEGMTDALCTMTVIIVLAMILPNVTGSSSPGTYTPVQLGFVAGITLVLFAAFTLFQTMGHRDYFLPVMVDTEQSAATTVAAPPSTRTTLFSLAMLLVSLVAVVLSAKSISPTLEALLGRWGAPATTLGIIIAAIVLMPEFGAAMRNAAANRLQSSLNLAIGSAIASIGLTIPVVAILAIYMGWPLELGLDPLSCVLLLLSVFVIGLTLHTGNTTVQPGVVHLMIFFIYLFFNLFP
jgi:Ca2+:H+ antiporter